TARRVGVGAAAPAGRPGRPARRGRLLVAYRCDAPAGTPGRGAASTRHAAAALRGDGHEAPPRRGVGRRLPRGGAGPDAPEGHARQRADPEGVAAAARRAGRGLAALRHREAGRPGLARGGRWDAGTTSAPRPGPARTGARRTDEAGARPDRPGRAPP